MSTARSFIHSKVLFLSIQSTLLQKPNYAFLWVTTDIMSRVLKIVTRRCTFKMPKKQQGKFPKCFSLTSASSQNISCFQLLTVDKSDFYRLRSAKLNLVKIEEDHFLVIRICELNISVVLMMTIILLNVFLLLNCWNCK